MLKYYEILLGGGGSDQKDHKKITRGEGGVHQKITEDHNHKKGGGALKKIGQIEGAHKENNYSQDQISVGDSGCDISIDQH